MIQQVSDSELELMKIIWENGGMALYADIMEKLAQTGRTWQKNTVTTLLSRLVSEEDYQADQMKCFLDKFYEGNAKGLVSTLIQREMLSPEDYEELKKFWEKGSD